MMELTKYKRSTLVLFLLLAVSAAYWAAGCKEDPVLPPKPVDSVEHTIAILVLDYLTYNFEGSCVDNFPYCETCDRTTPPFDIEYNIPNDYGSIIFRHAASQDTVFFGSIVRMGVGQISHPQAFLEPASHVLKPDEVPLPEHITKYQYGTSIGQEDFATSINSVWQSIDQLNIVHEMVSNNCQVAVFLFAPATGSSAQTHAKWIVFLSGPAISHKEN